MHRIAKFGSIAAVALLGTYMAIGCKATVTTGEAAPPPAASSAAPTPPPDKDSDGIADADDACPDKAGKPNADKAKNGCPEEAPVAAATSTKVMIVGTEVKITEKILFDSGKATIKAESDGLLNEIADVIKNQGKDIDLLEVGGHTDTVGDEKANLKLSDDRAKAVLEALVKRGVDAKKLRAKGYGQYCVIDTAPTAESNEKNRRVQFTILKAAGKVTTGQVGCDAAVKKGVKPQPIL